MVPESPGAFWASFCDTPHRATHFVHFCRRLLGGLKVLNQKWSGKFVCPNHACSVLYLGFEVRGLGFEDLGWGGVRVRGFGLGGR